MVAMPCRFLAASLRPTPITAPSPGPAGLPLAGLPQSWSRLLRDRLDPLRGRLAPLAFARYAAAFFVGVTATVAWQSWAGPAAPAVAVPGDRQMFDAIVFDTARRNIDRIAADIAAMEERVTRGVDQLRAGQEQLAAGQGQMAHDIAALQAAMARNVEPSPRPAPAANPVPRPSQARADADAGSDWRRQPCCLWPPVSSAR